jgi:hypothetical protein
MAHATGAAFMGPRLFFCRAPPLAPLSPAQLGPAPLRERKRAAPKGAALDKANRTDRP